MGKIDKLAHNLTHYVLYDIFIRYELKIIHKSYPISRIYATIFYCMKLQNVLITKNCFLQLIYEKNIPVFFY